MNENPSFYDVAVVGAGPAGSSAAYHLAKSGCRVLLVERATFPRDKACGDGLTRCSVDSLTEMGIVEELAPYQELFGVRVHIDTGEYRDSLYPANGTLPDRGIVVPRRRLDWLLAQKATQAGAVLWQQSTVSGPLMKDGRVCGLGVRQGNIERNVQARFVVAADGSTSAFASKVGLFRPSRASTAYAVRGYFSHVGRIDDLFSFYVPFQDAEADSIAVGYGWVFKMTDGSANIGVGLVPRRHRDFRLNLRPAFDRFITRLRLDSPFTDMKLVGPLRGAPLSFGLDAAECSGRGVLVTGDAAGLVDPLSGEGIGAALESGKLAAHVLTHALASPDPLKADLGEYSRLLKRRYDDRHQRAREHVRSYGFLMRLVKHTIAIDSPLIDSLRRGLLDDGAPGERRTVSNDDSRTGGVTEGAINVRRLVVDLITSQFPLLSDLCTDAMASGGSALRIQLALLSSQFGEAHGRRLASASLAAAIELAHLAVATHRGVLDGSPNRSADIKWGNVFSIMTGDFLLVKAYSLAARVGPAASRSVSEAIANVYLGAMELKERAGRSDVTQRQRLETLEKIEATFYELPCRLGATVGGAPAEAVTSLAAFGQSVGLAFAILSEPDVTTADRQLARGCARRAHAHLRTLPRIPARQALAEMARVVVRPRAATIETSTR